MGLPSDICRVYFMLKQLPIGHRPNAMNCSRRSLWLSVYQWSAGLCDTTIGILLIIAPYSTLSLMGVRPVPQPLEMVSFVGVFVLSVGIAYVYAARLPRIAANAARWETVWWLTALSRALVSAFLFWRVIGNRLEMAWLSVAITDGVLAVFQ